MRPTVAAACAGIIAAAAVAITTGAGASAQDVATRTPRAPRTPQAPRTVSSTTTALPTPETATHDVFWRHGPPTPDPTPAPTPQPRTVPERIAAAWPGDDSVALAVTDCETGGTYSPTAYNPAGPYYGLWQFDRRTWRSVGGLGSPSAASVEEQTRRAWTLYQRRGWAPWPECGLAVFGRR